MLPICSTFIDDARVPTPVSVAVSVSVSVPVPVTVSPAGIGALFAGLTALAAVVAVCSQNQI